MKSKQDLNLRILDFIRSKNEVKAVHILDFLEEGITQPTLSRYLKKLLAQDLIQKVGA